MKKRKKPGCKVCEEGMKAQVEAQAPNAISQIENMVAALNASYIKMKILNPHVGCLCRTMPPITSWPKWVAARVLVKV